MNKLKYVFHYFLLFLIFLIILLFTFLTIFRFTILNRDFVNNRFNDKYYDKVYNTIKKDMKESMVSTAVDSSVVDDIYTKNDLKNTVSNMLDIIYVDNTIKFDTDSVREKLKNNIISNLKEKGINLDDSVELSLYVDNLMKVYNQEFNMYNKLSSIGNIVQKIIKIIDILLIILGILIFIMILVFRKSLSKYFAIPLFSTSIILSFMCFYINSRVGINYFTIFSSAFSIFVRNLILSTFNIYITLSIIYLIIGIVLANILNKDIVKLDS